MHRGKLKGGHPALVSCVGATPCRICLWKGTAFCPAGCHFAVGRSRYLQNPPKLTALYTSWPASRNPLSVIGPLTPADHLGDEPLAQGNRTGAEIRQKVNEISVSEVSLQIGNACVLVSGYATQQGAEFSQNSLGSGDRVGGGCCEGAREKGLRSTIMPLLL